TGSVALGSAGRAKPPASGKYASRGWNSPPTALVSWPIQSPSAVGVKSQTPTPRSRVGFQSTGRPLRGPSAPRPVRAAAPGPAAGGVAGGGVVEAAEGAGDVDHLVGHRDPSEGVTTGEVHPGGGAAGGLRAQLEAHRGVAVVAERAAGGDHGEPGPVRREVGVA